MLPTPPRTPSSPSPPLELIFLGTGTSTSLPIAPCLTLSKPYPPSVAALIPDTPMQSDETPSPWNPDAAWPGNIPCTSCRSAVDTDIKEGWKNQRGNTSVVLRRMAGGKWRNVIVDVGKSFRQQAVKLFPVWGIQTIDAVILTHGHADAINGLDDLREWCFRQNKAIPVYLNRPTYEVVAKCFPYLVDKTQASGGGDVPSLSWHVVEDDAKLVIEGIEVQCLPVYHGVYFTPPTPITAPSTPPASARIKSGPEPLICLGFVFDRSIVYLSDISDIPPASWDILGETLALPPRSSTSSGNDNGISGHISSLSLRNSVGNNSRGDTSDLRETRPLPVLIIDALWPLRKHSSHFNLPRAMEVALLLNPNVTYLVGFTHPYTQFQWESLGSSIASSSSASADAKVEEDRKAVGHPQDEIEETHKIVTGFWKDAQLTSGLGERLKRWAGRVEPAWDGLGVKIHSPAGDHVDNVNGNIAGWEEIQPLRKIGWPAC